MHILAYADMKNVWRSLTAGSAETSSDEETAIKYLFDMLCVIFLKNIRKIFESRKMQECKMHFFKGA